MEARSTLHDVPTWSPHQRPEVGTVTEPVRFGAHTVRKRRVETDELSSALQDVAAAPDCAISRASFQTTEVEFVLLTFIGLWILRRHLPADNARTAGQDVERGSDAPPLTLGRMDS